MSALVFPREVRELEDDETRAKILKERQRNCPITQAIAVIAFAEGWSDKKRLEVLAILLGKDRDRLRDTKQNSQPLRDLENAVRSVLPTVLHGGFVYHVPFRGIRYRVEVKEAPPRAWWREKCNPDSSS